jgi:hypothetical protein
MAKVIDAGRRAGPPVSGACGRMTAEELERALA